MSTSGRSALFSFTLFVSAALLFLVQPLFARQILPLLGGSPAVWNTCMLFFQAALLAGYAFAHLRFPGQSVVHLGVLAVAAVVLPPHLPNGWAPPETATPVFWLLGLLAVSLGLPFVAIAASAPLLQKWFARTGSDPYFLYAASNLGSLLALVSYPLVVEPLLTLDQQGVLWSVGYGLLWVSTALCLASATWAKPTAPPPGAKVAHSKTAPSTLPPAKQQPKTPAWRWVLLAFIPSSMLLSVTTYLTTDVAAIPLFWVVPLALYLLTFTLTFARRPPLPHPTMVRVLPFAVIAVTLTLLAHAGDPLEVLLLIHLLALFVVAMVCNGELARLRPAPEKLTGFYLWLALGGVLGGAFNGLVAPLAFYGLAEYPLVLVLACLAAPPRSAVPQKPLRTDLLWPLGLGLLTVALILAGRVFELRSGPLALAVMFAVPTVLCYIMLDRPLRFGLGIAALFVAGTLYQGVVGRLLYQQRSFYGVHRVVAESEGKGHMLFHGGTLHGQQRFGKGERRTPRGYYYPTGPIGKVFETLGERKDERAVAVVGLGAGSLAAYGKAGQEFTFYEIDPAVIRIANDPELFTFLQDSPAKINIVPGDARLTLGRALSKHGLIVIDAFSSDAIPTHLLTREALQVYLSRLADDGILMFHVSNRFADLVPVVGDLAADAGLHSQVANDRELLFRDKEQGKMPSQWVLLTRNPASRMTGNMWESLLPPLASRVWTDDYCNLIGAMRRE